MSGDDKINILLVDDHPENLLALEAIIEHDDYNVIKALSGEEALINLLKYDFAAILMDVQMPGMDGFETAKIIKAREKTKNVPILFITANYLDSAHVFTGYTVGAIDYILKPLDPFILKAKVEGFVELYKMNQKLVQQACALEEKTRELEKVNLKLSQTTSQLRLSEALANVISETSSDLMIIIDKTGLILKVNPAVRTMLHYEEIDIIGKHISSLFSEEKSQKYIKNIIENINNIENITYYTNAKELYGTRKEGTLFPVELQIGKRYVQGRCIIAFTIRDITKKKQDQEIITHMAYHDSLTDLPNRRLFNDQLPLKLQQAKQTNQSLALMYLNLDHFKYINDSLGHVVGDKVLKKVAQKLTASVREKDFVARIGGDEFNIILPDTNREDALEIAEEIIDSFKEPCFIDNYELFVTACIGISIFPFDGEDSLVLMKNANAALYRAKELGKNEYKVFHSGMTIQSYKSFILQNDLRKAIERKELSLVYQPRIEIETGKMKSAEVLIRWNHPSWGTILPAEIIPLAEETGQIVEIGEWVLRTACRQNKSWQEAGLAPIRIAVNFSAQQFLKRDVIKTIRSILNEMEISTDLLEFEITESTILENENHIVKTLNQLRKMGIYISIDDFGTGYSSLNYLRKFPFQALKIDKSFIHDLSNTSTFSLALVSTIVSLAHHLNMSVIAEGVETEEQLQILRSYSCEEIQGYYFSPPVSPKEFEKFLLNGDYVFASSSLVKDPAAMNSERAVNKLNGFSGLDSNLIILNEALKQIKEEYSISSREMDVFQLIVNGLRNKEISEQLFISEHTVKNHITHIFQKLAVNDRLQAIAKVYQTCIEAGKNQHTL